MKPINQLQAIKLLVRDMMRGISTIKPAVVTGVKGTTINAKPLTKTRYIQGPQEDFPEVFNIPLLVYSGGGASITMPVKIGDTVLLFFSDRDLGTMMDTKIVPNQEPFDSEYVDPLKYYPVAAMPCFYTVADSLTGDPNNIVIKNKDNEVVVEPSGKISVTSTGDINIESSSNINITSSGDTSIQSSGNVDITGTLINLNGG